MPTLPPISSSPSTIINIPNERNSTAKTRYSPLLENVDSATPSDEKRSKLPSWKTILTYGSVALLVSSAVLLTAKCVIDSVFPCEKAAESEAWLNHSIPHALP